MLERLVANLVENAVRYNEPDGWVTAWTGRARRRADARGHEPGACRQADEQVGELVKPFSRLDGNGAVAARNADGRQGLGLGLSIVQAIVDAHGARLTTTPRAEGGLRSRSGSRGPIEPIDVIAGGFGDQSRAVEEDPAPAQPGQQRLLVVEAHLRGHRRAEGDRQRPAALARNLAVDLEPRAGEACRRRRA